MLERMRRIQRKIDEGSMTVERAAHLHGCLNTMEDILRGKWDDKEVLPVE